MSYSVRYKTTDKRKYKMVHWILFILLLAFCAVAVSQAQAGNREKLLEIMFPGSGKQTAEAFSMFAIEIENGQPFIVALRSFCQKLLKM